MIDSSSGSSSSCTSIKIICISGSCCSRKGGEVELIVVVAEVE